MLVYPSVRPSVCPSVDWNKRAICIQHNEVSNEVERGCILGEKEAERDRGKKDEGEKWNGFISGLVSVFSECFAECLLHEPPGIAW